MTQTRHLGEAQLMPADLISLWLEVPIDDVEVRVLLADADGSRTDVEARQPLPESRSVRVHTRTADTSGMVATENARTPFEMPRDDGAMRWLHNTLRRADVQVTCAV